MIELVLLSLGLAKPPNSVLKVGVCCTGDGVLEKSAVFIFCFGYIKSYSCTFPVVYSSWTNIGDNLAALRMQMWIFLFCFVVIYVERGLFTDPEGYAFECTLRETWVWRDFFYSESTLVIYKRIKTKFTRFIAVFLKLYPLTTSRNVSHCIKC